VRIEQLRREFEFDLTWRVFPLHPEIPEEGMTLEELFSGRIDIAAIMTRLNGVASELELPFGKRIRTYNSRRAQELGKWAEDVNRGDQFKKTIYHAYFVDGRNIAQPHELTALASMIDLDPGEARQVLDQECYAAAVDADWQRASELGVTAVPTVVYGDRQLVGFQAYDNYRRLLAANDSGLAGPFGKNNR